MLRFKQLRMMRKCRQLGWQKGFKTEICSWNTVAFSKSLSLQELLLMEKILHQLIGSLSHYLQGFLHPRWCKISSIPSTVCPKKGVTTSHKKVQVRGKMMTPPPERFNLITRWWFQILFISPLPGEMIQFD